jgi:hypothetical protein
VRSCTHERTRAPARLSLRAGRRPRRRPGGGGRADVAQRRREAARCPVRDSRRIERRASGRRPGRRGHQRHEADRANDRYFFRGRFESADLIRGVPALDDPHERRRPARTRLLPPGKAGVRTPRRMLARLVPGGHVGITPASGTERASRVPACRLTWGRSFAVEAVLRRDVDSIDVVLVASGRGNSAPGPLTTLRQEQRGNRGGSLPMSG